MSFRILIQFFVFTVLSITGACKRSSATSRRVEVDATGSVAESGSRIDTYVQASPEGQGFQEGFRFYMQPLSITKDKITALSFQDGTKGEVLFSIDTTTMRALATQILDISRKEHTHGKRSSKGNIQGVSYQELVKNQAPASIIQRFQNRQTYIPKNIEPDEIDKRRSQLHNGTINVEPDISMKLLLWTGRHGQHLSLAEVEKDLKMVKHQV